MGYRRLYLTLSEPPQKKRHMTDFLVGCRPFGVQAVGLQHIPVIGGVENRWRLRLRVEGVDHATNLVVNKAVATEEGPGIQAQGLPILKTPRPGPHLLVSRLVFKCIVYVGPLGKLKFPVHRSVGFWAERRVMGFVEAHHQEIVLIRVVTNEVDSPVGTPMGKGELRSNALLFHNGRLA